MAQQQTQPEDAAVSLGEAFIKSYYGLFDNKDTRQQVANLYHPQESVLYFEGTKFQGAQNIMMKYSEMNFGNLQRVISTTDMQPVPGFPGILIQVQGQLKTDSENDKPMPFSQTFILRNFDNNYFLCNDVFRLALHNM